MTRDDALAALPTTGERFITVATKAGSHYRVWWDTLETQENGYVYGERCNGQRGPFRKKQLNGTIRWFRIESVTLVPA
jgi:hypothetical protein